MCSPFPVSFVPWVGWSTRSNQVGAQNLLSKNVGAVREPPLMSLRGVRLWRTTKQSPRHAYSRGTACCAPHSPFPKLVPDSFREGVKGNYVGAGFKLSLRARCNRARWVAWSTRSNQVGAQNLVSKNVGAVREPPLMSLRGVRPHADDEAISASCL